MLFKEKICLLKQKKNLDDNFLEEILCNNYISNIQINVIKEYIPNIIYVTNNEYSIPYDNQYIKFKINDNKLFFINVFNCDLINGKIILENIIKIAKKLNIKYIDLQDESIIKINKFQISLPIYSILLHGSSYFNKYDFFSIDNLTEINFNKDIRNLTLDKFNYNTYNSIHVVIKNINYYFKKKKSINNNDEKVIELIKIIEIFKNLLKYNNKLRWINKDYI